MHFPLAYKLTSSERRTSFEVSEAKPFSRLLGRLKYFNKNKPYSPYVGVCVENNRSVVLQRSAFLCWPARQSECCVARPTGVFLWTTHTSWSAGWPVIRDVRKDSFLMLPDLGGLTARVVWVSLERVEVVES